MDGQTPNKNLCLNIEDAIHSFYFNGEIPSLVERCIGLEACRPLRYVDSDDTECGQALELEESMPHLILQNGQIESDGIRIDVRLKIPSIEIGGRRGIFSKDYRGTEDGGHFGLYLVADDSERDKLRLMTRFQTANATDLHECTPILEQNRWYLITMKLGPNHFELSVDGVKSEESVRFRWETGSSRMCGGTEAPYPSVMPNTHPWVIGHDNENGAEEFEANTVPPTGVLIDELFISEI